MGIESERNEAFENYNETEVQDLLSNGWQMDADGLDEQAAQEMIKSMSTEYRAFRKEDGTCTILVKQESAYESMGGYDVNEMRSGVRGSVDEVMGEGGSNNRR